ncbi:MAG TPA: PilZ domain-containing protein [Terriglobales bacterium]|nr:PilZ domain-containing protein [Terriglobales bacterium]
MGKRREPRKEITVPVRIFGTDSSGQIFSEKVNTVNVSRHGAELNGVKAQLKAEEIVGVTYGQNKGHFRVQWAGPPGTPKAGHVGLFNLSPEKPLWDFPLPLATVDATVRDAQDRRRHPRVKATNSVEIYPNGQATPIRARTADLSLGGCFVEMSTPLTVGTSVRLGLWVGDTKLWINGKAVSLAPGFGNGISFVDVGEMELAELRKFLGSLSRLPI